MQPYAAFKSGLVFLHLTRSETQLPALIFAPKTEE
jgi:hypothetical protein